MRKLTVSIIFSSKGSNRFKGIQSLEKTGEKITQSYRIADVYSKENGPWKIIVYSTFTNAKPTHRKYNYINLKQNL